MGYLLLEGGAEFGGRMREPDERAIALAGGPDAPVAIIPTAAAPDNNHARAGGNGVRWFRSLGAQNVESLPLTDRAAARSPAVADALRAARLIYMLGGFPHYLGQTLLGSEAWRAAREAHAAGAVLGGSSAGAMVLCEHYFDPQARAVQPGLGMIANSCVLPHHNTFGKGWAERLGTLLPNAVLIGIDERTGMIDDGPDGAWQVYGQGSVTLYRGGRATSYKPGQGFVLQ